MTQRIVFVPSFHYLSNPFYFPIARQLKDARCVYLDTMDPEFVHVNRQGIDPRAIREVFDEFVQIPTESLLPFLAYYFPTVRGVARPCSPWDVRRFAALRSYVARIHRVLEDLSPSVIVMTTDLSYSMGIVGNWAWLNTVPVAVIQPSFLDMTLRNRMRNPITQLGRIVFRLLCGAPLCSRQCLYGNELPHARLLLWGEYFRRFYEGTSVYPRIHTTGNAGLDTLLSASPVPLEDLLRRLRIPANVPLAVICTQDIDVHRGVDLFREMVEMYRHLMLTVPGVHYYLKVHPRETEEKYRLLFADIPDDRLTIGRDVPIVDLLRAATLQVSAASYTSFLAVALGVPILLVNPRGQLDLCDYFGGEIGETARDAGQLVRLLTTILSGDGRETFQQRRKLFLESRLGSVEMSAAKRTAEVVQSLARSESPLC